MRDKDLHNSSFLTMNTGYYDRTLFPYNQYIVMSDSEIANTIYVANQPQLKQQLKVINFSLLGTNNPKTFEKNQYRKKLALAAKQALD